MLTLQVGQCGNQLGYKLFDKIIEDIDSKAPGKSEIYIESSNKRWFNKSNNSNHARAILIDTERKVIDRIVDKNNNKWCFKTENIVIPGSCGAANNWAFGYSKIRQETEEYLLDVIQRELEQLDKLDGFLYLLGLAGGTGSGVGSFIAELIRNYFPTKSTAAVLVFPYPTGEIVTQNYNIVLSLGKIVDETDLTIILENENLDREFQQKFPTTTQANVAFPAGLNDLASEKIVSLFQPARNTVNNDPNTLGKLIEKIIPHPAYKLTAIDTFSPHSSTLISSSKRQFTLSNILLTRGSSIFDSKLITSTSYAHVNWLSTSERFTHFHENCKYLNNEYFSTILTNNSKCHNLLFEIKNKAWTLYTNAAFLHQYKKFGLEDDDFLRVFAKIEHLTKSYKNLERN